MKKLEYYINLFHFIVYKFCVKYQKYLPLFDPDINSGRILMFLTLIPAMLFFNFYIMYCKIIEVEFQSEFIFLFIIPFGLLVWFSVIHKDKYLTYFNEFEKKPKEVIRKWAWVSFLVVFVLILMVVVSFWLL